MPNLPPCRGSSWLSHGIEYRLQGNAKNPSGTKRSRTLRVTWGGL